MLTPEREAQIDELLTHYPVRQSALMPVLWLVQDQFGWISLEAMRYVAMRIGITPEQVREVVTFYTMFNQRPIGRYHLQICGTTPCQIVGCDAIIKHTADRLGVRLGETTADGLFTVSQVECLGSCGTAPMMQINREKYRENLTPEKVDAIIEELRARAAAEGNGNG